MSIEQWSDLLFPGQGASDSHTWGSVKSVNTDGSYEVQLNTSSTTTRCAAGCTAGVGDRVLVCIMANGRCVAVARLEGEYAEFRKRARFRMSPHLINGAYLHGERTDGEARNLIGMNSSDNLLIGYGLYDYEDGITAIYGNEMKLYTKTGDIYSNGVVSVQATSAYNSAAHTLTTSLAKVSLGTVYNESGTTEFMSLSNGGIKCTKDGKAIFSAYARFDSVTSGDLCHLGLYRDSTQLAAAFSARASGTTADVTIPPVLINVTAGCTIYLYASNGTGARGTIANSARNCVTLQYVD